MKLYIVSTDDDFSGGLKAQLQLAFRNYNIKIFSSVGVTFKWELREGDLLIYDSTVYKDHPGDLLRSLPCHNLKVTEKVDFFEELRSLSAGFVGVVEKGIALDLYPKVIRCLNKKEYWFSRQLISHVLSQFQNNTAPNDVTMEALLQQFELTPRELQLVKQMYLGKNNSAIANDLHISVHTVKSHVSNILAKLELNSRNELQATLNSKLQTYTIK
ncbi:LuxR C-terminal-related transcriptional regulator [Paraferrimonas sp. SM1919]|uniref:LuxR C-terminal-related transcriptional regulator n=1 Tax=Paraferrimonas sp. SM1919 TaxID=2662263 RepID=UPI0013CFCB1A|nr:LuxR C-terminal-related transcriptional regulator [Paraferrimonas sp. SM1919]